MSATNRGSKRIESDFYSTPKEAFEPMLPFIKPIGVPVWEPACGDVRLISWMRAYGIEASGSDINAKDNPTDFLSETRYFDCIVTNPPFSLAFEFCNKAFYNSDHAFLLLRLNFLASQKRKDWFMAHEPDALFVLSKRPCFTSDGKTDSCDYAWYYWGSHHKGIHHL